MLDCWAARAIMTGWFSIRYHELCALKQKKQIDLENNMQINFAFICNGKMGRNEKKKKTELFSFVLFEFEIPQIRADNSFYSD